MANKPQEKILQFIRTFLEKNQIPPTLREIQEHCGFSAIGTIQYHIKNLVQQGLIEVKPKLSRGITLTERAVGIPILGSVPAGPAQLAFEHVEGYIPNMTDERPMATTNLEKDSSTAGFSDGRGLFALRIKGDSMIGAGILESDLVIVRPQASAKNGDIVVARVNQDDATVKRLVRKPGVIHLAPENSKYRPIPVDENVEIIGKVIRVVRHYS